MELAKKLGIILGVMFLILFLVPFSGITIGSCSLSPAAPSAIACQAANWLGLNSLIFGLFGIITLIVVFLSKK